MSIFATLFGSRVGKKFQNFKSLFSNFTHMCRLPFFQKDSEETQQLMNTLKICSLHLNATTQELHALENKLTTTYVLNNKINSKLYTYEKALNDLNTIVFAQAAINKWLVERGVDTPQRKASQRHTHIFDYKVKLAGLREKLFTHIRCLNTAPYSKNYLPDRLKRFLENNFSSDTKLNQYKTSLARSVDNEFSEMNKVSEMKNEIPQIPDAWRERFSQKVHAAILLPLMNITVDFDSLDMLFDGFNYCLSFANFF